MVITRNTQREIKFSVTRTEYIYIKTNIAYAILTRDAPNGDHTQHTEVTLLVSQRRKFGFKMQWDRAINMQRQIKRRANNKRRANSTYAEPTNKHRANNKRRANSIYAEPINKHRGEIAIDTVG